MENLFYLLAEGTNQVCGGDMKGVLGLVGKALYVIKLAVPIILIFVGTIEMVQAITSNDQDNIKKATTKLLKKAIAAIVVFLVPTIVGLLMSLVGGTDYKDCKTCLFDHPWSADCGIAGAGD